MTLSQPQPQKVTVNNKVYDYLAFYFPGNNTDWDNVFGVPYFGNFWQNQFDVQLNGPKTGQFHTAEAAYQASKWWNNDTVRKDFESKATGAEAFSLKRYYQDSKHLPHDGAYGGYSSGEDAMYRILLQKFDPKHTELHAALKATGDAYLLEHGAVLKHQDMVWSDGNNGEGTNHLGESLMAVRGHYFPGQDNPIPTHESQDGIRACTAALRVEMKRLGLSADDRYATNA